jgi:alkaline phosphatase D
MAVDRMMSRLPLLLAGMLLVGCSVDERLDPVAIGAGGGGGGRADTRIAFGSCMHQDFIKPALEWGRVSGPDVFVFLGDNIYGDSDDPAVLAERYAKQATSPELQRLRASVPTVATWDDHDYGQNDIGSEYPSKVESKALFLDFWDEPEDSQRRAHDGIYTSYLFEENGGTLQLILLDTRWFRDPLDRNTGQGDNDYQPTSDTGRTMLGAEQWTWLEAELRRPADVRIIGTSIQFGHSFNGWESWTNMPHERQRLVDVLRASGAEVTIFISGDAHWAELSRYEPDDGYPLYDLTSSGITEEFMPIAPNDNRVGDPVAENNTGYVDIDWGPDPRLTLGIVDVNGVERIRHEIAASSLRN